MSKQEQPKELFTEEQKRAIRYIATDSISCHEQTKAKVEQYREDQEAKQEEQEDHIWNGAKSAWFSCFCLIAVVISLILLGCTLNKVCHLQDEVETFKTDIRYLSYDIDDIQWSVDGLEITGSSSTIVLPNDGTFYLDGTLWVK